MAMQTTTTTSNNNHNIRLVWHRRDLRVDDHFFYQKQQREGNTKSLLVCLYVFDVRQFQPRPSTCCPSCWDAVDVGPYAACALIEAVKALRTSLRNKGGELLVRVGNPLQVVPEVAQQVSASSVCWSEEPGVYEVETSKRLYQRLCSQYNIQTDMGYTLWHPNDLPTNAEDWSQHAQHPNQKQRSKRRRKPKKKRENASKQTSKVVTNAKNPSLVHVDCLDGIPRIMGDFRRAARAVAPIRPAMPVLIDDCYFYDTSQLAIGDIPTLDQLTEPIISCGKPILGMEPDVIAKVINAARCTTPMSGESVARQRLYDFLYLGYAKVANRALADVGENDSSKLSIHLALGTLSPRRIVETVQQYNNKEDEGEACNWLISHLEMRDFFLYTALAGNKKLFSIDGMPISKQRIIAWQNPSMNNKNKIAWTRWATGQTGLPLVDAAMKELMATGYCSNRVRQNAASVLTKDLCLDWRAGAEWFQWLLKDHCVGANWGNWQYFAGVGSDPKQRHFRTISQAKRYDPDGSYVAKWFPNLLLSTNDVEARLRPWNFVEDWGTPMIDAKSQYTWQDMQLLEEHGRIMEVEEIDEDQSS